MSYFNALLIAEARKHGRAQRSAQLRHRHLATRPLGMVLWQLGAEPLAAAAVAWGLGPKGALARRARRAARDRELAFRALATVARSFNTWFEGERDEPPQVVIPAGTSRSSVASGGGSPTSRPTGLLHRIPSWSALGATSSGSTRWFPVPGPAARRGADGSPVHTLDQRAVAFGGPAPSRR